MLILFYFVTPEMVNELEKQAIEKHNSDIYGQIDERKREIEKHEAVINQCNQAIQDKDTEHWERKEYQQVKEERIQSIKKERETIKSLKLLLK